MFAAPPENKKCSPRRPPEFQLNCLGAKLLLFENLWDYSETKTENRLTAARRNIAY